MQTQSNNLEQKTEQASCPRRLVTDRIYLKDNRDDATARFFADRVMKTPATRLELDMQSDTIIQKKQVDEVTQ